jgi:hypothetical protein
MNNLLTIILLTFTTIVHGQEILWDSTFVVDKIAFKVLACRTDTKNFAQIIKPRKDTITINDVNGNIEIIKFDSDQFPDIVFSYLGSNYTESLFLYDKATKAYKMVEGFEGVSDAKRLRTNPRYYYSYHRAGCADMNWVSNLFYIQNFKIYQIGKIYGQGCESENSKRLIEISKVVTLNKVFITETLPIDTIDTYEDYKWGFIENYWNKNFGKFKNKNAP